MSVSGQMMRGSFWMIGMNWSVRLIGIVNTMILARLLTPEDFGVFAMAFAVFLLVTYISEMGVDLVLIREEHVGPEHYSTAWTIWFLQNLLLALILFSAAPLGGMFFQDERVTDVIRALSVLAVVSGLRNIGIVDFRKGLVFRKEFLFGVYKRLGRFAFAIPIAFMLRSYWAFVISFIVGMLFEVLLSYRMHPFRPRISFHDWRMFVGFSFSIIGIRVGQFLSRKIDLLVVGRLADGVLVGTYNLALELSRMIVNDIVAPIGKALFPGFSKIRQQEGDVSPTYLNSIGAMAAMVLPAGIGLSAVAEPAVAVILGSQWDAAVPYLQLLAIFCAGEGVLEIVSGQILIATHRENLHLRLVWMRTILFAVVVTATGFTAGVDAIPVAMVGVTWGLVIPFLGVVSWALGVPVPRMLEVLARPLFASLGMYIVVRMVPMPEVHAVLELLGLTLIGAATYVGLSLSLWLLFRQPEGLEKQILTLIRRKLRDAPR